MEGAGSVSGVLTSASLRRRVRALVGGGARALVRALRVALGWAPNAPPDVRTRNERPLDPLGERPCTPHPTSQGRQPHVPHGPVPRGRERAPAAVSSPGPVQPPPPRNNRPRHRATRTLARRRQRARAAHVSVWIRTPAPCILPRRARAFTTQPYGSGKCFNSGRSRFKMAAISPWS
jgi:hypothetical protein